MGKPKTETPLDRLITEPGAATDADVTFLLDAIGKANTTTTALACIGGLVSSEIMRVRGKGKHATWRRERGLKDSTDYLYRRIHTLRMEAIKAGEPTVPYPVVLSDN